MHAGRAPQPLLAGAASLTRNTEPMLMPQWP